MEFIMAENLREYTSMKCAWVWLSACICLYSLKHLSVLWPFPKEECIHHVWPRAMKDRTAMGGAQVSEKEDQIEGCMLVVVPQKLETATVGVGENQLRMSGNHRREEG